jgi:phenylacetic acid degradation operon negative regulatory protein
MASGTPGRQPSAIRPLTARSVVLSTLLGYRPPALPVRVLVRVGALFDIAEPTIRVALTRMVADGDVTAEYGVYRLSERLLLRQERQEEIRAPRTVPWDGTWETVVISGPARPVAERTVRRRLMLDLRFAELREGVWLRPANLARPLAGSLPEDCTVLRARPEQPRDVTHALWDLDPWAEDARRLRTLLDPGSTLQEGFLAIAEALHHLQEDPCLPAELLPDDWPGDDLREHYTTFRAAYAARLREYGAHD